MSDDYDYRECDKLFDSLYPVDYFYHSIYDGRKDAVAAFRACYRKLRPKNVDHEFKELEKRLLGAYSTIFARSLAKNAAAAIRQQAERIAKLQAFKDFVHMRLDLAGIEKNPDGIHSKADCRIGDRLDIALAAQSQLATAQQRLERWEGQRVVAEVVGDYHDNWIEEVGNPPRKGTKLIARLPDDEEEKA